MLFLLNIDTFCQSINIKQKSIMLFQKKLLYLQCETNKITKISNIINKV